MKNKLFWVFVYLVSFSAFSEERIGIPTQVMFVNSVKFPTLWIYIDENDNKNCAKDGIIKLSVNDRYSEDELKMWSSLALTAFTANKSLRVWYSNEGIENGLCLISNMSIRH